MTKAQFVPIGVYRPLERKVTTIGKKVDRTARRSRNTKNHVEALQAEVDDLRILLHAVLNNFNLMAVNGTISQAPPAPPK